MPSPVGFPKASVRQTLRRHTFAGRRRGILCSQQRSPMRHRCRHALLLCIGFLLYSLAAIADTPESMRNQNSLNTQSVTNRDNGTELHFRVGDVITLRLEASPGTGYSWQVSGYDASVLTQIGNPAYEELRSPLLGGATHQLFHFSITSPGVSRLELEYRRPWEEPGTAKKVFSITVIAQERSAHA